jgi:hypothetical protein
LRSNAIRLKIRLKVATSSLPVLNINSNTNTNFVCRKMISETKLVCAGGNFWLRILTRCQQTISNKWSIRVVRQAEDLNQNSRKVKAVYVLVSKTNNFHCCMQQTGHELLRKVHFCEAGLDCLNQITKVTAF